MAGLVFILGAGASVHAGAPVMKDFFDRSEHILAVGDMGPHAREFRLVFEGLSKLEAVFAKSHLDLRNLEAVFVAFEMQRLLRRRSGATDVVDGLVERLPAALRQVIVTTLERAISFPVDVKRHCIRPPLGYSAFAEFLGRHVEEANASTTIITFNYDCALDYALAFHRVPYTYGLDEAVDVNPHVNVLKLHGSLNWAGPPTGNFYVHKIKPIDNDPAVEQHENPVPMPIADLVGKLAREKYPAQDVQPVIVPPTASKADLHHRLQNVWILAAEALSKADTIVILGYSLPPTDEFFRYLFALGTIGPQRLHRVWVCDAYPNVRLDERYRSLLGPMAAERYSLAGVKFESAAATLKLGGLPELGKVINRKLVKL
jgi:hypothetical protein